MGPDLDPERVIGMRISVADAQGQLTDLVRWAEAEEDIVLTRLGQPVARLVPARRELLEAVRTSGAAHVTHGPDAARSQDFLYGEDGMPD
jgi:prevent-host-death family protein